MFLVAVAEDVICHSCAGLSPLRRQGQESITTHYPPYAIFSLDDALGRRIEKIEYDTTNITTRYYYYYDDGWRVLSETNAAGEIQRDYVYGNYLDEALMLIHDDGEASPTYTDYYYAHNHLYSPVALIEDDGDVVERYEYDVYGKPYFYNSTLTALLDPQKSTKNNPVMFTGQRMDTLDSGDLQLMYYKNRFYCPDSGRFLQRDPRGVQTYLNIFDFTIEGIAKTTINNLKAQYLDGMNIYEYVKNTPIVKLDPSGLGCGECFPPPPNKKNVRDVKVLGFGKTAGAYGTPELIDDVKFIKNATTVLSGLQTLGNISSGIACGKIVDATLDAADSLAGEPGDFGDLALQMGLDLGNILMHARGSYLWMQIEYHKCVPCTYWSIWAWYSCRSGEREYVKEWHPCWVPDPRTRTPKGKTPAIDDILDIQFALIDCFKALQCFPENPKRNHDNRKRKY